MQPVPARWSSFYVNRDDEVEPASAFCCVVSAGIHLGALVPDEHVVDRVMGRLELDVSHDDMTEKGVRALARAAGLQVWRPNKKRDGLELLADRAGDEGETLWMVLTRMKFVSPTRPRRSFTALHYVLVLDVLKTGVLVADPHPWHEPIHVMPKTTFLAAWESARGPMKSAWAGCLARSTG